MYDFLKRIIFRLVPMNMKMFFEKILNNKLDAVRKKMIGSSVRVIGIAAIATIILLEFHGNTITKLFKIAVIGSIWMGIFEVFGRDYLEFIEKNKFMPEFIKVYFRNKKKHYTGSLFAITIYLGIPIAIYFIQLNIMQFAFSNSKYSLPQIIALTGKLSDGILIGCYIATMYCIKKSIFIVKYFLINSEILNVKNIFKASQMICGTWMLVAICVAVLFDLMFIEVAKNPIIAIAGLGVFIAIFLIITNFSIQKLENKVFR